MSFLRWTAVLGVACAASLAGCARHVVYVRNTDVGIGVALSPAEQGKIKFTLGYDQETFALVPKYTQEESGGTGVAKQDKAMSLAAVSHVESKGLLNTVTFNHVVATGGVARAMAKSQEGLRLMRNAVYHPPGVPGAPGVELKAKAVPGVPATTLPGGLAAVPVIPVVPMRWADEEAVNGGTVQAAMNTEGSGQ